MENVIYQRPREKLQDHGVASLSLTELLQVVLGSGGSKVSVATLARQVSELIGKDSLRYESLVDIEGVGVAKACQILAALELSKRVP